MAVDKEWLASLKAGDRVAYSYGRIAGWIIDTVLKVTPTGMIRTGRGKLFKNGYCKGSGPWDVGLWLHPVNENVLEQLEVSRLKEKIRTNKTDKLSLQQLRQINEILENAKEE